MENNFELIDLGWDSTDHKLKISLIKENETVRFNKVDEKNHNYPGPEISVENIPKVIEALIKIYNKEK